MACEQSMNMLRMNDDKTVAAPSAATRAESLQPFVPRCAVCGLGGLRVSDVWYFSEGKERVGPLDLEALKATLETYDNAGDLLVWRPGLAEWRRARDVLELGMSLITPPPMPAPEAGCAAAQPATQAGPAQLPRATQWRWAGSAALLGLVLALPELIVQWLDAGFQGWAAEGLPYKAGHLAGTILIAAAVGLVIGSGYDRARARVLRDTAGSPQPAPVRPQRFDNVVARHWRGEYPLGNSYWVVYVLGAVGLGAILLGIKGLVATYVGFEPRIIFAAVAGSWLAIVTLSVWQFVGVWRSAGRRFRERVRLGKQAVWATLARVSIVLAVAVLVFRFAVAGLPEIVDTSRIAFFGDPTYPPYSIRLLRNGTEAEIIGGFKYGLADEFLRVLRASPQIKVVHLDSAGGRLGEAKKLNELIRAHDLITYVRSRCNSACVLAFAGGRERWLHADGRLGFHAPTTAVMDENTLAEMVDQQKEIFAAAGVDSAFVERALATPNSRMWQPSADDLLRAKVITAVSDGTHFAISGYGVHTSRESLAASAMTQTPILQAMRERLPNDYAEMIALFYNAYTIGQTEAKMITAARRKLFDIVLVSRSLADDAVLVEWGRLLAEQYAALGAKDPSLCYLYATEPRTRNFLAELPDDLIERQFAVEERIIATAAPRAEPSAARLAPVREKVQDLLVKREPLKMRLLLLLSPINPSQHADYCDASIAWLEVVTGLPENEAALFLRHIFRGK